MDLLESKSSGENLQAKVRVRKRNNSNGKIKRRLSLFIRSPQLLMAVGGVDRKILVLDFLRVLLLYIQFLQKKITEQY